MSAESFSKRLGARISELCAKNSDEEDRQNRLLAADKDAYWSQFATTERDPIGKISADFKRAKDFK